MNHRSPETQRKRRNLTSRLIYSAPLCLCGLFFGPTVAEGVDFQPLGANVRRVIEALNVNGAPFDDATQGRIDRAFHDVDVDGLIKAVDSQVVCVITLDKDNVLRAERGSAPFLLQQGGYRPVVVKIKSPASAMGRLDVSSPQAEPVYGGEALNSLVRQGQTQLSSAGSGASDSSRGMLVEFFQPPMMGAPRFHGREVEYAVLVAYAKDAGKFEAQLQFRHIAAGSGDEPGVAMLTLPAEVRPAVKVKLSVRDFDASPTVGRFIFRDARGHIYPPQTKRLAPDFFFQQQIYRRDGDVVLLPPGEFTVEYSRGPEYRTLNETIAVHGPGFPSRREMNSELEQEFSFSLQRWIDPQAEGFYSGDHHIHGAGCAHYTSPTEGVTPADMFLQVKGEGLNVGSVLTWGPCYEHQRQFFSAKADPLSEPFTLLKYDVEVSGFGSQALGHTCLLNLRDQTYPGSDGTKTKGWPTWTTPVLRWTKEQGGFTGYPHSASGLAIDVDQQSERLIIAHDVDGDRMLNAPETRGVLLPEPNLSIDANRDGWLSLEELKASHRRAVDTLPNYAIPEMNGSGAMEICVSAAHGVCDFISAMDTERIQEWNTWYHLLNCGLPVACAGETDFPCMSSTRVGQGRTYVRLGKINRLDYTEWCRGLAEGRSYVSDGYAHALGFRVDGRLYGEDVKLKEASTVTVHAEVAFSSQTPPGVPYGVVPNEGLRQVGDTRTLYPNDLRPQSTSRLVEVVVNGNVVARATVPANDAIHRLSFEVPIEQSSWVAIRQFPQLHTNPIRVLVADRPIRASRRSAEWCIGVIEQLWRTRAGKISEAERPAAKQAFEEAKEIYRRIARECTAARLQ